MSKKFKQKTGKDEAHDEESTESLLFDSLNGDGVEPDRLTYHMGRRISDGDFGNISMGFTLSSSVKPKETIASATERVVKYVQSRFEKKLSEIVD